mgnify:CR=1 FL=1
MGGDLAQRQVHLGWIALASLLAPLAGQALPVWLDGITALSAAGAVVAVGRLATHRAGFVAAVVFGLVYIQFRGDFEPKTQLTMLSGRAGCMLRRERPPRWSTATRRGTFS